MSQRGKIRVAEEGRLYTTTSLPGPDSVQLERVLVSSNYVTVELAACRPAVLCPACAHFSDRIHSHYVRTLADLPWQKRAVLVRLHSRRFFCVNGECKTRIFTERLPEIVAPHGRRTLALSEALHLIGMALGGRAGARLAQGLKIHVGRDSVLRALRRWAAGPAQGWDATEPRVVGIDDWAFRKGQRYGTILCDLERHRVIDMLPERSAKSAADWFRAHPSIQIISRDRGGVYAEAAREGAPQATQVADRWHLLKNLGDMMQRMLDRQYKSVRQAVGQAANTSADGNEAERFPRESRATENAAEPGSLGAPQALGAKRGPKKQGPTQAEQSSHFRRERRHLRYEEVISLHQQGMPVRHIADQLGMSRITVRRYVRAEEFPELAPRAPRLKEIDAYVENLRELWDQGCHNGVSLWRAIRQRGFTGSQGAVYRAIKRWQGELPSSRTRGSPQKAGGPSPRQIMWLLLYPEESHAYLKRRGGAEQAKQQEAIVEALRKLCPDVTTAATRCHEFIEMIRKREYDRLDSWLGGAKSDGIPELTQFANGIQQDYDAVKAAMQNEWSNGPVEGHVNRLKMVKRQMYGRANFDLLKLRVSQAA